ncbi:uncharacterized protein LOC122253302 [Penaeus japonicus]|uniref:uncharacterized protein LOC122253302 n=1 Tax=Penaeus japonicus TaxID=27405 RepID=UPI001C7134A0|nr:uncharacterized protein LOC122253302 [Penaeus japonicus]XP_042872186.1 uncharacterized protein LOC122253302 [Penaeus japonicus]
MAGRLLKYLALVLALVSASLGEETQCPDKGNSLAVADVLSAMNKLLSVLAREVRSLKSQVEESCWPRENETLSCAPEDGGLSRDDGNDTHEEETDDLDDETADGEDGTADGEDGTADGQDETADGEDETADGDNATDTDEGTAASSVSSEIPPSPKAESQDDPLATTTAQPPTTIATTVATTTTTSEPLPPVPTSCPSSFSLLADGCFFIISDRSDWRTWGDAHAFCQRYGGELAAPYRLAPLQEYLDRHYSDTFWVGARLKDRRRYYWFNKKKLDKGVWKKGQPSRHPTKKCVYLDKLSGYRATNFFCGEKYPFVCGFRKILRE